VCGSLQSAGVPPADFQETSNSDQAIDVLVDRAHRLQAGADLLTQRVVLGITGHGIDHRCLDIGELCLA
jgi:hypothetical protein